MVFSYLPNKKFTIIFIAILVVLGGWFLVSNNKGAQKKIFNIYEKNGIASKMFQNVQKDSDNDGLADWEEALWKTDPNNPDTDGDGTKDGEEVKEGRDPTKPGPDDKLEVAFPGKNVASSSSNSGQTSLTGSISKDLLSRYLMAKRSSGGKIDELTKKRLIDSILSDANSDISGKIYKISDIKISQNNSKKALKIYGNQLGATMEKYNGPYSPETEIIYFKEAIEKNDKNGFAKLDKNISTYKNIIKDFLAIKVPSDLASQHLVLINALSKFMEITKYLKNYPQDSIGALMSLKQYYGNQRKFVNSVTFIFDNLRNKGVFFKENEPGGIINKIFKQK